MQSLIVLLVASLFAVGSAQDAHNGTRCDPCNRIDIVFAIENSNNLNAQNFAYTKQFVQNFANLYEENMGSGAWNGGFPRLGVTTWSGAGFSTDAVPLTSNYTLFTQELAAISWLNTPQSNITNALLFPQSYLLGTPSNVPRILVVVAYGHNIPNSYTRLGGELEAARLLLQQGTQVILVSIGSNSSFASWIQFGIISGYFGYNFTIWAEPSYQVLANDSAFLNRLWNTTCWATPLPRLIRPLCPLDNSGYHQFLKAYPPGGYALGTILPTGYTTWGYLNINPPPNFPSLSFTISLWVFLRSPPPSSRVSNWTLISQSVDGDLEPSVGFHLGLVNGYVHFVVGNGGNYSAPYLELDASFPLTPYAWNLISVNVEQLYYNASYWPDQTDYKYASIWINGYVAAATIFTANTTINSGRIQIGRSVLGGNLSRCDCVFDEVQIWNLCQAMGTQGARVNRVLSGKEPNLIGYWNFEDASEWNIPDLSPSNNSAVPRGTTPWITQVAELSPFYCAPADIPTVREFETVCHDQPS